MSTSHILSSTILIFHYISVVQFVLFTLYFKVVLVKFGIKNISLCYIIQCLPTNVAKASKTGSTFANHNL